MRAGKARTEGAVATEWLSTYCNVCRCYGFDLKNKRGKARRFAYFTLKPHTQKGASIGYSHPPQQAADFHLEIPYSNARLLDYDQRSVARLRDKSPPADVREK
jgi:hypothetical protein